MFAATAISPALAAHAAEPTRPLSDTQPAFDNEASSSSPTDFIALSQLLALAIVTLDAHHATVVPGLPSAVTHERDAPADFGTGATRLPGAAR